MDAEAGRTPYSIHHELMNHLAVMSSYASLLADDDLTADQLQMVEEVRKAAGRANKLVRELREALDLHAPEKGATGDPEQERI